MNPNNIDLKEIELINNIIKESVEHGGDPGGAYFCSWDDAYEAINNYLKYKHLDEEFEVVSCEYDGELSDCRDFLYPLIKVKSKDEKTNVHNG